MTGKKERPNAPRMLSPNAVLETKTVFSNGSSQIDRTIYDENGLIKVLIHSGPHNRPDQHKYGRHGERKHVFTWKEGGKHPQKVREELTDAERREHADILKVWEEKK